VLAVTAFVRLGLAVLTAATFLRLGILRLGWLGWNRPDVHDDDLLHDLIPGLAPDLLAELLGVEFPAHHHHLLLLLVLELHLLDAELLCISIGKQKIIDWPICCCKHRSEFRLVS